MRSKEFITELANTFYPYELSYTNKNETLFVSAIPQLRIYFYKDLDMANKKRIIIEFSVRDRYSLTKIEGAESLKILSTVVNIIKNELPKLIDADCKSVMYTAKSYERSRVKLYDRAAKIISNVLGPNWMFSNNRDNHTNYGGVDEQFYIWERRE